MKFEHKGHVQLLDGFYEEETDTIYVSRGLTDLDKECTYFHEKAHRECCRKGCGCWNRKSEYLSEYHAYMGELKAVVDKDSKALTQAYLHAVLRSMVKFKFNPKLWESHRRAMSRMMRSDVYVSLTTQGCENE